MSREIRYRLLGKLFVLAFLSFCIWEFSGSAGLSQRGKVLIPVSPQQLRVEGGVIPVELRCTSGQSSAPGVLDSFSCVLLNNTNKGITAANVIYSVVFKQNGSESRVSYASTVDKLLHPDFASASRPIKPGMQSGNVGPPGPISSEGADVIGVEISIDYVEFEDGSRLGPDKQGSRIIGEMRGGAEKYKEWLRRQYVKSGRPSKPITSVLNEQQLPSELQISSGDEKEGAKAYRARLRKMSELKGEAEVKHLLGVDQ